jgi:hypothetical protein
MKPFILVLMTVLLITGCALETGRAIEFKLSPQVDRGAIHGALQFVAGELGLVVEGPEAGPGGIVEYRARLPTNLSTSDFFISVEVGERPRIVIRTMNTQTVESAIPERAFGLLREELDKRGIKYEVRRG